jgi:hypothetical protein
LKNSGEAQRAGSAADLCLLRSPFVSFRGISSSSGTRISRRVDAIALSCSLSHLLPCHAVSLP